MTRCSPALYRVATNRTAYAAISRSVGRCASRRMGAREQVPSQGTATKRHSSLRLRGRSAGPFHNELKRLASGKLAKKRISRLICSGGVGRGAFGEDGAHALGDLARAEGFGHVLVGATQQAALAIDLLALGTEHDHVRAIERRVLFDLLADFVAVHVRHHDVHENQRRSQAADTPQALFAGGRGPHGVALPLQPIAHRPQDVRLVVDDEDWPRHVRGSRLLEHGVVQLLFMVLLRSFQAFNAASMAALTTSGGMYRHLSIHSGGFGAWFRTAASRKVAAA